MFKKTLKTTLAVIAIFMITVIAFTGIAHGFTAGIAQLKKLETKTANAQGYKNNKKVKFNYGQYKKFDWNTYTSPVSIIPVGDYDIDPPIIDFKPELAQHPDLQVIPESFSFHTGIDQYGFKYAYASIDVYNNSYETVNTEVEVGFQMRYYNSQTISYLGPKETVTMSTEWLLDDEYWAGNNPLTITVDNYNNLDEWDEYNNSYETTMYIDTLDNIQDYSGDWSPGPVLTDLKILNTEFYKIDSETNAYEICEFNEYRGSYNCDIQPGDSVFIRTMISNGGNDYMEEEATIEFSYNGNSNYNYITGLAPDDYQYVESTFYLDPNDPNVNSYDYQSIEIKADSNNVLYEFDETDNSKTIVFEINRQQKPDLTISNLKVGSKNFSSNDLYTYEIEITNLGNQDVTQPFSVSVYDGESTVNQGVYGGIAAGESKTVTLSRYLQPGNQVSTTVAIDIFNEIQEINENNYASESNNYKNFEFIFND
ncbi:hypothetical protein KKG71_00905 [Patescibacteria group bacterium]|nr:hypothetical protein [Patescibacteria group bacterium]